MSGKRTKKARRIAAAGTAAAPRRTLLPLGPLPEPDPEEQAAQFRRNAVWVIIGVVLFIVVYSLLAWLKYRSYQDARFDLGNMVQAVYNTAHGHFLEITTGEVKPRQMSRLGSHVDPILALFALPWLIWPSPVMLLVLQVVIVATGAWPAYRLGARLLRDARAGAFLAGAYLLYPALGYLVLNEFHPVALAAPLLLWAFLYLEEDRWIRACILLVLAATCKETVPLVIALLGVYFAIRKRSWRPLLVTVAAATYFIVAVWVIIPHFNGGESSFVSRYADYGDGASEVIKGVLTDPGEALGDLLSISNLSYLLKLLWPFGFASLLSPLTVLIAAPEYALNALSSTEFQRRIEFHYTALEIPFLYAAAVLGVLRFWRWLGGGFRKAREEMAGQRVRVTTLALLVLLAALAGNFFMGPLPFSLPGARLDGSSYARDSHSIALDEAVAMIPDDAVVSTNNNIGAQLSARRVVYVFPYFAKADWVIVDEDHPFWYDKENKKKHQLALGQLVLDTTFQSVYAKDGVYVFKRTTGTTGGATSGTDTGSSPSPSATASASPSASATQPN